MQLFQYNNFFTITQVQKKINILFNHFLLIDHDIRCNGLIEDNSTKNCDDKLKIYHYLVLI